METRKKSRGDSILVQSAILAAAQILVRVIGLFYRVPLQRIIGDDGNGYYGYAYQIYQFLLLLSSSAIPTAVALLVSKHLARREYKNVLRIFKGALLYAVIVGGVVSLLTMFGARGIAQAMFSTEKVAPALAVLAPTIFISAVMGVYRGYFQGKNAMMPTAVSQLIEQVLHAVVSVVAAWFLIVKGPEYGAAGGTLGTCLGALGGLIFVMIVYHLYKPTIYKLLKRDASKHLYSTNHVMKLVTMTMAPVILSSTIYQISGIVDSSMFSKIMGGLGYADDVATSLFGIYSGQYQMIINIPLGITSSIGIALIPTITKVLTLGRYQEARNKIDSVLKLTNVLSIPCFVGLAVLAEPIMKLLFVVKNDVPANLLMLGGVTVVLYSFSTVTIAVLQGIGKMKTPVINAAISLGIHIIFVFILLQFADMNIYALVYGNIVFSFAMCGLNLVALYRYIGYRQEILHSFVLPGAASAIMGAIVYFIYKGSYFLIHSNLVSVMISVVAGVAAYGIALILMGGISEEEMYSLPKGSVLVRLCRKFHML